MSDYRSSIRRVEELDLADKSEQPGSVAGNAVVRPAGEMELTEFADLVVALLENTRAWQTHSFYQDRATG